MVKGDNIQERMIDFSVRIVHFCRSPPRAQAVLHIGGQLLRSGTAPAAHYAEARGAESTRDFTHKLKMCLKELNESTVWLQIVRRSNLLSPTKMTDIIQECQELSRIINASINTAARRLQ